MLKILLTLLLALSVYAQEAHKVVFDLTTGDLPTFEQKILKGIVAHKNYFEGRLQELDVAVVIHDNAYKFFMKDPKTLPGGGSIPAELGRRIATLADTYDVVFLMCRSGMDKHGIKTEDVLPFVATIPNAGIGLIEKQNEGYAYLPVSD